MLFRSLFVIIPPATRVSRFEANNHHQQQQPRQAQRYVGGRKRKRTAARPAVLKKPRLQHEAGEAKNHHHLEDVSPRECNNAIASLEPIREDLVCAHGEGEDHPNPLPFPSSPDGEEVNFGRAQFHVDTASCAGVIIPVGRDADDLKELSTVEEETSFNEYMLAKEDGELSFAEGKKVDVLIDPPDQWVEARKENDESGFVPSNLSSPTAVVKTLEPMLSFGAPQETTRSELCLTMEEESGDTPFSKGECLVRLNCEGSSGEAPETDGSTGDLVPLNPPKLSAATSSPPVVIQETITRVGDPAADAQEVLTHSEKATEVHMTANPPAETELTSMQQPAIPGVRQNNEGAERNRATGQRSKIRVSFPTKPGAHRAKKVSLALPP